MPLSSDIYRGVGQQSMGGDLAGSINQFVEQRNRLADLANQRAQQAEMQGFQTRALQRAEEAYPAQQQALQAERVAAQRQAMQRVGRDIDLGIYSRLQSGIPREEVAKWAQQEGLSKGLSPEQIQAGIAPLSQIQEPDKLASYYQRSAMPQEVMKAELEAQFRKPNAPTALANIYAERSQIAAANPNDPRLAMYDQLIQKTVTTPPATQIVTTEGGGMQAITLPKVAGQKPIVQPLGIQAVPKGGATAEGEKPMPVPAMKMQQEALDNIGISSSINADLGSIKNQIETGKLKLSPSDNLAAEAKLRLGISDESAQNYSTFKNTINKLRNDTLRLNKGTQTEGDAVRALDELFSSLNDQNAVKKRLGEIIDINKRAVKFHENNINILRKNYGNSPIDLKDYTDVPSALSGTGKPTAKFLGFE